MRIAAILLFLSVFACERPQEPVDVQGDFFRGNHLLMSLNSLVKVSEKSKLSASAGFFVVVGSLKFNKEEPKSEERTVHFVWKNNLGQFVVSELPMSLVRFQIVSDLIQPTCKFRWRDDYCFDEARWVEKVIYVVFTLNESQVYSADIKLDLK